MIGSGSHAACRHPGWRMTMYEEFFRSLNAAGARYVVVGGLAVVLHGHPRLTADIDLILDLEPDRVKNTLRALEKMEFRPRVPVALGAFADARQRQEWAKLRGMTVFNLYDPRNPLRSVDLFVENPIPFEELWSRAVTIRLPDSEVRVASIPDLIRMKREAGRPIDLEDIRALEAIESAGGLDERSVDGE